MHFFCPTWPAACVAQCAKAAICRHASGSKTDQILLSILSCQLVQAQPGDKHAETNMPPSLPDVWHCACKPSNKVTANACSAFVSFAVTVIDGILLRGLLMTMAALTVVAAPPALLQE